MNFYRYVGNAPGNGLDPSGLGEIYPGYIKDLRASRETPKIILTKEELEQNVAIGKAVIDFGIGFIPGVGEAKDWGEAIAGYDIYGNELAWWERGISAGSGLIPFIDGGSVRRGVKALVGGVVDISPANFVRDPGIRFASPTPSNGIHLIDPKKLPWNSWANLPKVVENGKEYAKIGDRLYTGHAVDRTLPSGLGHPAGGAGPGRSISPTFVEDVIRNGSQTRITVDGVPRIVHTSGTVKVVTEQGGRIVITVNPFSGG